MNELLKIVDHLRKLQVINKNGYKYIILPFDFESDPEEIRILANALQKEIKKSVNMNDVNKILTIESKGIALSTITALNFKKKLNIVRKRKYDLPNEIEVIKNTGYEQSKVYINNISKGDKIIIVDDLISTGGTLDVVIEALLKVNCEIKGIFIIFDKIDNGGSKKIMETYCNKLKIPFKTLIRFQIENDNNLKVTLT
jgi:adenine phosphoribosyltransferase